MGIARIEIVGINEIKKDPTPHIQIFSVNLIMSELAQWQVLFDHHSDIIADFDYMSRLFFFAVPPLAGSMKEIYEWNTDVMRSRSGLEQRICLRKIPRLSIQFELYLDDEQEQARLESKLFAGLKGLWGIPIWSESSVHDDTINVDDTTIYFDTSWANYVDGGLALVWQGIGSYEMVSVGSVETDRLELASSIVNQWTGRKWVVPLRLGHIKTSVTNRYTADGQSIFSATFSVTDHSLIDGYTPELTYDGLPVITKATLDEGGIELQTDGDNIVTDFDLGRFDLFSDSDYDINVQGHVFWNKSKSTCWSFKQFIHYLRGRQKAVWIPTYKEDMVLMQDVADTDTVLMTHPVGWADDMGLNDLRTYLAFVFPNGDLILREITNLEFITDSQGDSTCYVTLGSAVGRNISIGDCELSFIDKCRLSTDKIELEYDEPFRHYCRVSFTRIVE